MAARSVALTAAGPRPLDGRRSQLHARKVRVPTDERRAHGHGARGARARGVTESHARRREADVGTDGRSVGRHERTVAAHEGGAVATSIETSAAYERFSLRI